MEGTCVMETERNADEQFRETDVTVVSERPCTGDNSQFPVDFNSNAVLILSISNCILGSIFFLIGIANIVVIPYCKVVHSSPICCGSVIVLTGMVGCIGHDRSTKFWIGAFCALSITSLILTTTLLAIYGFAVYYSTGGFYKGDFCSSKHARYLPGLSSREGVDTSTTLLLVTLVLIVIELGCSIAAAVFSCKAYCKCCTTYNINDCCVCVGCCECDTSPLDPHQQRLPQYYYPSPYECQARPVFNVDPTGTDRLQDYTPGALQSSTLCSPVSNVTIDIVPLVDIANRNSSGSDSYPERVELPPENISST